MLRPLSCTRHQRQVDGFPAAVTVVIIPWSNIVPAITLSNPSPVVVSSIRYCHPVGVEAASRFVNGLAELSCEVRADTIT